MTPTMLVPVLPVVEMVIFMVVVVIMVVVVVEIKVVVEILNHTILEKVNLHLLEDQTYWNKLQVTQNKSS